MAIPKTSAELQQRALDFVRAVLPTANGIAQLQMAAAITDGLWPRIEAARGVEHEQQELRPHDYEACSHPDCQAESKARRKDRRKREGSQRRKRA